LILNRKQPKIKKPTRKTKTDDKDLRIKQLELELTQAREYGITEDQEALRTAKC
jgi:DNA-binding IclR family transcriptional regulator